MLEAVEVEQREHERATPAGRRASASSSSRRQRAAVAEPGQRVGQRLVARRAQDADVLAERQRQPDHHEHERGGGEADGERVEVAHRGVDEQLEADRAGDQRRDQQAQAVAGAACAARRRRLPRGGRDQGQAGPPAGVEPAAGLVDALGGAARGTSSRRTRRRGCRRRAAPRCGRAASRCRPARRRRRRAGRRSVIG